MLDISAGNSDQFTLLFMRFRVLVMVCVDLICYWCMLFGFESSSMANAEDEHVIRKGILKHPSSNLDEGVKTVQYVSFEKIDEIWTVTSVTKRSY